MARALSIDLRRRVIAAIVGGLSCRQAAERFGVSPSTAIRWDAEYPGQRQYCAETAGRRSQIGAPRGGGNVHRGAGRRAAGPYAARTARRAAGAWTARQHQHDLALAPTAAAHIQKRMARPVCKRLLRGDLTGLRQRIRSRGDYPGQDGGPRALVLIKAAAWMRHLLNQGSRAPGQPSGHLASTTHRPHSPPAPNGRW